MLRDIRSSVEILSMSRKRQGCVVAVSFDKFAQTVSYKSNSNPGLYTVYESCAGFKQAIKLFYFVLRCWPFDFQGT
jgi:hypothetical protein